MAKQIVATGFGMQGEQLDIYWKFRLALKILKVLCMQMGNVEM